MWSGLRCRFRYNYLSIIIFKNSIINLITLIYFIAMALNKKLIIIANKKCIEWVMNLRIFDKGKKTCTNDY